ncbi:hypothetical protein HS088_TW11G00725 [Tripterygium wilfordii]|uniref:Protein DCL chloroplastic n=1 Tax=Tripterygium wilfordii TaxID=458696 RepID=A0A7J7D306_TRIWF|nr:DNA-directed RNA polymerase V subunit 1-like isoform X2 [Tripterygium wilfordii]KAF5740648.1 hypothetical protein HS088_TW11G00725 [Tripterygium wilfordii]
MAAAPLLRGFPLLRFRLPRHRLPLPVGSLAHPQRPWCSAAEFTRQDEDLSSPSKTTTELGVKNCHTYQRRDDPDYRKWKDKEEEIRRDIEPIILLTKDILHSDRYMDGEQLTIEDEKAVVQKLLAYHPHSEDKIGCGLDSIMAFGI